MELAQVQFPGERRGTPAKASDSEIQLAIDRFNELHPYIDRSLSKSQTEILARKLGISRSQVFNCLSRLRDAPNFTVLLRHPRGRKAGVKTLDGRAEELLRNQIAAASRSRRAITVKTIYEETDADCAAIGVQSPCLVTVRRRVAEQKKELLLRRKLGTRRAQERTKALTGKIQVVAPLHDVEIDHSPLDIYLVTTESRVYLGRAFLTLVVDWFSRSILGFNLGLEEPSALSVALALTNAVMPKDIWLAEHGMGHLSWPMHGLPKVIHVDGGSEFRSQKFESACTRWGIKVSYRNKKEDGGIIERAIGTVQGWASQEPGASGSDPKKNRREPDPRKEANMTLFEAEQWLARQIIRRYHNEKHGGIGVPPIQAWEAGWSSLKSLPTMVNDKTRFFISFLPSVRRVISHDGIHIFKEVYFSDEARLHVMPGITRPVHYDPRCMGLAYVDMGKSEYLEVRYTDPAKRRLPLFEIEAEKRKQAQEVPMMFDAVQRRQLTNENRQARTRSQEATRTARRNEILKRSAALEEQRSSSSEQWTDEDVVDEDFSGSVRIRNEGPV
ncbi:DDE-type integrase/transposase/recombinase [uncultured Xanthomonas sp.]|uniref:DDE-type integrase/transposase/recombinase n=1 Tax=uncultured Xanthomonas sp. TaxID=152831 RepID=UPI0025E46580|nr:DDE-type integrase/transposase/recombinase [uncultured Xanthomonas sp.]